MKELQNELHSLSTRRRQLLNADFFFFFYALIARDAGGQLRKKQCDMDIISSSVWITLGALIRELMEEEVPGVLQRSAPAVEQMSDRKCPQQQKVLCALNAAMSK